MKIKKIIILKKKIILKKEKTNKNTNPLIICACHTDSKLKLKSLIYSLKYYKELSQNIILINSLEFNGLIEKELENVKIKMNIIIRYTNNTHLLCHQKWYEILTEYIDIYKSFILTNDSIIVINSLHKFKNEYYNSNKELVGLLDSWQVKYHYPDFLRYYNKEGIIKWINFYLKNRDNCNGYNDLVHKIEIESTNITKNRSAAYNMDTNYKKNIHFDDEMTSYYLNHLKYPIIKIKKIQSIIYTIDPKIYKLNDEEIIKRILPKDFKSHVYKELHSDLSSLSDSSLERHFVFHGVKEGRKYKFDQQTSIPHYIKKFIKDII